MGKRKLHEFIDNVEHKCCTMCKQWKLLDQFGKHKRKWDKLQSNCKTCKNVKEKQRQKVIKEQLEKAREMAPSGFLVCLRLSCKKGLQPIDQFISAYVRNDEPRDYCKTCFIKKKETQIRREAPCQKVWDDWRKMHPCVKCMNDPEHEHNYLLIEADHLPEFIPTLGVKLKACSQIGFWSHSKRGPAKLRVELKKCQALCGFHHALVTQQRRHETKDPRVIRKRAVINAEKHKRGCCLRCERLVKKGEECAFHFDHRDSTTKFIRNGKAVSPATLVYFEQPLFDTQWPIEKELVDLLCTNCHKLKDNRDGYRK